LWYRQLLLVAPTRKLETVMISLEEGLSWCSLVGCTRESTS
jgi:hypothetical protein